MKDNTLDIKSFLNTSPNVSQILAYVESEAQRIASERRGDVHDSR